MEFSNLNTKSDFKTKLQSYIKDDLHIADQDLLKPTDNNIISMLFNATLGKAKLGNINDKYQTVHDKWLEFIQDQDNIKSEDLISLVALFATRDIDEQGNIDKMNKTKTTSRELKASREAILAEISRRNTNSITKTMKTLSNSASFVGWVGVALTFITVILTGLTVYQSLSVEKNSNTVKVPSESYELQK